MRSVERYARTLSFAGHTWAVKQAPSGVGPGCNAFSAAEQDVFVDEEGLHLRVVFREGRWWATEVFLVEPLGHGTYVLETRSRVDVLDPQLTFGVFSWDPYGDGSAPDNPHREIDFEDSRWGAAGDPTNAQMVVQTYFRPGHLHRYTIPDLSGDASLTRFFRWLPGAVEFVALRGQLDPASFGPADVIDAYTFEHDPPSLYVPAAGRATLRLNLWPNDVTDCGAGTPAPSDGQAAEVVITDFQFVPEPGPGWLGVVAAASTALLAAAGRRR